MAEMVRVMVIQAEVMPEHILVATAEVAEQEMIQIRLKRVLMDLTESAAAMKMALSIQLVPYGGGKVKAYNPRFWRTYWETKCRRWWFRQKYKWGHGWRIRLRQRMRELENGNRKSGGYGGGGCGTYGNGGDGNCPDPLLGLRRMICR